MTAGPSVWTVADGRAGILNQSKALAAALAEPERAAKLAHIRPTAPRGSPVILQPTGWQVNLRPDLWPAPVAALPPDHRDLLGPPWPDIWIAAGRRSIPYSRIAKKSSRGKTLVVQIQNPKVSLSSFDLVIPPEHDRLTGPNVLPIVGPPVWHSSERIAEAKAQFGALLAPSGQKVLVSLGGESRTHDMTRDDAGAIEASLLRLARDRRYWITVSRRTPQHARVRFRKLAEDLEGVFWESEERDGPNPYLAFLSLCDAALVTEDSANMIADPTFFGKPVHIMKLTGQSRRFERLYDSFIRRRAARRFLGQIETWSYEPLREAGRAADEIVRLMLKRRPALGF
jgi:mitochondrial fission protein ELM1